MKYFVATLCLMALFMNRAIGQTTDSAEVFDEVDSVRKEGATSESPNGNTKDVVTCYRNLRDCFWENTSASKLVADGGLENLINKCRANLAGCDKSVLQAAYDVIKKAAALAGDAAHVAGSAAQKLVNQAMDTAFEVARKAGKFANDAVNTAGGIASDAIDTAGKIANDAANTAADIAKEAAKTAKDAANAAANAARDAANAARDMIGRLIPRKF